MQMTLCGAVSKSTGQACKNIAGKGTDHVGQGKCKFHGGSSRRKHGMYAAVIPPVFANT